MKVHVITKDFDSPWPEDRAPEIVKVFKGTRIRAATTWCKEQEKKHERYAYYVETWEVE